MSQKKIIKPTIVINKSLHQSDIADTNVDVCADSNVDVGVNNHDIQSGISSNYASDEAVEAGDEAVVDPQPVKERKKRTKKIYPPSEEIFEELINTLSDMRDISRKLISLAKEARKSSKNESKELNIKIKRDRSEKPSRKPRGFALPSLISDEMINYLVNEAKVTQIERKVEDTTVYVKIERGCLLARNELTSILCNHFKNSQMRKNESDKRDIHLDHQTSQLFGIDIKQFEENGGRVSSEGEPIITYFDLQKYLSRHYIKRGNTGPPLTMTI